jgi:LIVCS family branched-chain amino acid:cation transporter
VSPIFATLYAICIYAISIALPSPRTASVTYEMAIAPYFNVSPLVTSSSYFALVLLFVLNRSKLLDLLGKWLTPLIIIILVVTVCMGLFLPSPPPRDTDFAAPFAAGILEGYQTFDAIGGVVVGGVIVISFAMKHSYSYIQKRKIIGRAGLLAGFGLCLIYTGLIAVGARYSAEAPVANRTELLTLMSTDTLGRIGTSFLAVLVALACFTTAVGIVTGTADFVKGLLGNSQRAYVVTAIMGCMLGVAMGQFNVAYIIDVAVPALMLIYPLTIVLIILNVVPSRFASPQVFKGVVLATLVFSLPDFMDAMVEWDVITIIKRYVPLASENLGWLLPAGIAFAISNLLGESKNTA